MNDNVILEVKKLYKTYENQEVLKGISTTIQKGDVVAIIGPSGCGKSTFLRSLNLLEVPTEGQILFEGTDLTDKKVLIVDDICCLGGTAYNAALKMKEAGAKEVAFYISHCEDGIFVGKILHSETIYEHREVTGDVYNMQGEKTGEKKTLELSIPVDNRYVIDKVYTADTMLLSKTHPNIIIIK